ncbi:MAG: hopanoid biosynthesis-associated protein HpnK [candidate division NC10 bacterium]|nr:hopanoid biosynthesis-associated protein HpnK [candidate division NC10 bacterium]
MKRLIVTGDDFGLSSAVNQAIVRAHEQGLLTSASLMVNGPAASEAVALAKAHPRLAVGLHLVLCQGRSTLPPYMIPGLVDAEGHFSESPVRAGLRYFFLRSLRPQLRREIEAQLAAFVATGLAISHLDGHVNVHLHPTVLAILLELAGRYGIRAMRLPLDDLRSTLALDTTRLAYKLSHALIFGLLCRYARGRLVGAGVRAADRVYGLLQSGDMNEAFLLGLLPRIRDGLVEWYCHVGLPPCPELARWTPTYRHRQELEALTSELVLKAVAANGFVLTSYRELLEGSASPSSISRPPSAIR